jgi:predicted AAA+ superfamily ATPase
MVMMVLKRKMYQKLLAWKEQEGKTSLLLGGAHRVGKSFIVREFAEKEYKTSLIIDFSQVDDEVKDIFIHNRQDLDTFFLLLQTFYSKKFITRSTLIVFDEVQRFPIAREFLKTLVADGRYDYLETGSLLSIRQNIKDIVLPSEEEKVEMFPLDFEEFLWAIGDEVSYPIIKIFFEKQQRLGQAAHGKLMLLFRQYILVGGMPQAVVSFAEHKDFQEADTIKRGILDLYREDIAKYAAGYEDKVRSIFDNIPGMLSKAKKNMVFSSLAENGRYRSYESAFLWLSDAMITNDCYLATDPNVELSLTKKSSSVKCYLADTGLLVTMLLRDNALSSDDLYKQILFNSLSFNEGMLMENVVAQMLRASGHSLFFYEKQSQEARERMEMDFLISKGNMVKMKLSPIEVKSGRNYTYSSLDKFKTKFSRRTGMRYILHDKDLDKKDDVMLLPLYMAGLI